MAATKVILFEPRRTVRLAASAVQASAQGFGGSLPDLARLHLVHGPQATAGQIVAALTQTKQGADHAS